MDNSRFRYEFKEKPEPPPKLDKVTYGPPKRKKNAAERDFEHFLIMWMKKAKKNGKADQPPPPAEKPKPKPKPEMPKVETPKRLLVKDIDLHVLENTQTSKTDIYECTESKNGKEAELVVRRGNYMKFTITFDRPYDKKKHDMKLHFKIGKKTSPSRGTAVYITLDEGGAKSYDPYEWGAYLLSQSGNAIVVMVHIPADCIVGEWTFNIKTFVEGGKDKSGKDKMMIMQWNCPDDVSILFNPWCKHDDVYMEKSELLNEYILNESGAVWRGNYRSYSPKPWNFGQFEDDVLGIVMYILRLAFNTKKRVSKGMADPVQVSRKIVSIINSNDNDGVLEGNWSGDYEGGISPLKWGESPKILRKFMQEGTVQYGQCWVFSCVTTAVFRCLGIPCRTVTNFASAHDTNGTNVIECTCFIDDNGVKHDFPGMNDSVWNFHVWNEVYFARPDLNKKEYDGWQVVDATPQEESDNVYTCGPCPVAAIKEGCVNVNYDASFVFSEVNADRVWYKVHWDETVERTGLSMTSVGKRISTKYPDGLILQGGEECRLDLTSEYKYPEGSEEERKAVKQAYALAYKKKKDFDPYKETIVEEEVKLKIEHKAIMIGQNLEFEVTAKNMGFQGREIRKSQITIAAKSYTGTVGQPFHTLKGGPKSLDPRTDDTTKVSLTPEEYWPHLAEQSNLYIEAVAWVSSAQYGGADVEITKGRDFTFDRPVLAVKGSTEEGKVGVPVVFKVAFRNPLAMKLTNCEISMTSAGFENYEDKIQPDVDANGEYRAQFTMIPKRKKLGEFEVNYVFDSKQLQDITGNAKITIS